MLELAGAGEKSGELADEIFEFSTKIAKVCFYFTSNFEELILKNFQVTKVI